MKFISWNVNGLRACVQKGFLDYFHSVDADFFCIQESKLQEGLYFTGEILDYDGPCGGYNLNHAWLTGERAGRAAASALKTE